MERRKRIIGNKYGKLRVERFCYKDEKYNLFYECSCECGNVKIIDGHSLRRNKSLSCGCSRLDLGEKNSCWKGCGDISGSLFCAYRHSASKRNLQFDITIKQIWELFLKQNRKCILTNLPIYFPINRKSYNGTASLDRIDSSKGYTISNVQWVHKQVNEMKMDQDEKNFIEFCHLIAKKNPLL